MPFDMPAPHNSAQIGDTAPSVLFPGTRFINHSADTAQRFFNFCSIGSVTAADKTFAAGTEHRAGNNGNTVFFYKLRCKFFRCKTGTADIGKHIKSTFRLCNGQPHVRKRFIH